MAGIKWELAVTSSGRILERVVTSLLRFPSRIPEPGTFPYGSTNDLDELGMKYPSTLALDSMDPFDHERVGRVRHTELIGSEGLTPSCTDTTEAWTLVNKIEELLVSVKEYPQYASDPEFCGMVKAACLRAQLMGEVIRVFEPDFEDLSDQLSEAVGLVILETEETEL